MSMLTTKPLFIHASFNVTNVATDFTIIAAPGAGLTLIVLMIRSGFPRNAAAQGQDLLFTEGAGGTIRWSHQLLSPGTTIDESAPFVLPGWVLPANTALVCNATSTIAGPTSTRVNVQYQVVGV